MMLTSSSEPRSRLYGRKQTRPLSASQQAAMAAALDALTLTPEEAGEPVRWFKHSVRRIVLEIGFGNGEHLAAQMKQHPADGFIGVEPFLNGMASFLKTVTPDDHARLRVVMGDARLLIQAMPAGSIDSVYLLNPDPWPKKRHHKRRFVQSDTVNDMARILKPDGTLIMTSDHADLAEWMAMHAGACPDLAWAGRSKADWHLPPAGWIPTPYERWGTAQGRQPVYLVFKKACNHQAAVL